jgi:hypothetical protein
MTIPPQFILCIVLFGPGIIACYVFFKKIQRNRLPAKDSIDQDLSFQLPAHSSYLKIESLHEAVTDKITFLVFPTIIHAVVFYLLFENNRADEWTFIILFVVESAIIALLGFQLWRLLKELKCYQLGYRAEVFVSQLIQPLTLMGYCVHHDIEIKDCKVDHVIVSESGVFCLKTSTFENPKEHQSSEVEYDGSSLIFPWGNDSSGLKQVQDNASNLSDLFKEVIGETIPVHPILLLPDWKVKRKGKGPVNVINPKDLPGGLFYFPDSPLSDEQVEDIELVLLGKS